MKQHFEAAQLFTPEAVVLNPRVVVEDGRFMRVGTRDDVEFPAGAAVDSFPQSILAPGYIDIHIHGNSGHDVMEATPQALEAIQTGLLRTGVTRYLPTTVTASVERTLESLKRLGDWISGSRTTKGAVPLGLHLEGPFISHAKRGVHPPAHILRPSNELFDRFYEAAGGAVRLMTVAPETEGAPEMVRHAKAKGVVISIGHSDATFAEAERGVAAGARHATHTFNAMRPLDHREPGILGAVLADARLSAEIIADGIHVHPEMVKLFIRAKGIERAVLVTDAISATGMGDGTYNLGDFKVTVRGDRCEHEDRLAGSVLTLDRAVRNTADFAEIDLFHAVRMASANPARLLGLQDLGVIREGAIADLNVLTPQGAVVRTFVGAATP